MKYSLPQSVSILPHVVAAILFVIFSNRNALAEDQNQLQEIWQKRIPNETKQRSDWSKSHITTMSGTSVAHYTMGKDKFTGRFKYAMKRKDAFYLTSTESESIGKSLAMSYCYGLNSKYCFELKKSKNGKDWLVSRIIDVTPEFDDKQQGFLLKDGFRSEVDMAFDRGTPVLMLPENTLVDPWKISELPGFHLKTISIDDARHNIFRVNFDYKVVDKEHNNVGIVNCVLDFDLDAKCLPIKSNQVLRKNGIAEETVLEWTTEMTQLNEKTYGLKSSRKLKTTTDSVVTRLEEMETESLVSADNLPESDFTLSAFGFPEPPGVEWKKPFPWYLVLAAVGTACLGVFFFLRSRARRRSGAA